MLSISYLSILFVSFIQIFLIFQIFHDYFLIIVDKNFLQIPRESPTFSCIFSRIFTNIIIFSEYHCSELADTPRGDLCNNSHFWYSRFW